MRALLIAVSLLGLFSAALAGETKDGQPGPQLFDLLVVGQNSSDSCPADPGQENGTWEPGETIELFVELGVDALGHTGISGTLTTDNPGVVLLEATQSYPDIPGGGSAFNPEPYRLLLTTDAACFEDAGLELTVTSDSYSDTFVIPNVLGAGFEVELPFSIPDITSGDELTMEVFDDVVIEDLDVHIVVEHTWVGDLGFTLRSPAGTEVLLLDRPGSPPGFGCSNDDMDITFDDDSPFDPETHCEGTEPWYEGDANPIGDLSDFNGESSEGSWTLIITDSGGGDIGDIYNWELLFTPVVQGPCSVCGGMDVPAIGGRGLALLLVVLVVGSGVVLHLRS